MECRTFREEPLLPQVLPEDSSAPDLSSRRCFLLFEESVRFFPNFTRQVSLFGVSLKY
jgi:hypothetical protein